MKQVYLLLLLFIPSSIAYAQTTVTIAASKDNTIYSEGDNLSNGAGQHFFAGVTAQSAIRRALLYFDLSTLPQGAVITSASLKIYANKLAASSEGITVARAGSAWGEGTSNASSNEGSGAAASTGDATWLNNVYPGTTWSSAGGDFSTITATVSSVAEGAITISNEALRADVASFINNPAANFGWMIMGSDESGSTNAIRFSAREHTNVGQRPTLSVSYTVSLPVTLMAFKAETKGKDALLHWQTAGEINNKHFVVEHSIDGANFVATGTVKGNGTSAETHYYTFLHSNIAAGNNYYRLNQYDLDGNNRFSAIIKLNTSQKSLLKLFPNPATSFINLTGSSAFDGSNFTIANSAGEIVKTGVITNQRILVNELPAGQYWLVLVSKNSEHHKGSFFKK